MKHFLFYLSTLLGVLGSQRLAAQTVDPRFNGSMSRAVMETYLSRAITMDGLTKMTWCPYNCPPPPADSYDPAAFDQEVAMLASLNARFIGRAVSLWESEELVDGTAARAATVVQRINQAYAAAGNVPPIVQGAVFEILSTSVTGRPIEDATAAAFGYPTGRAFHIDSMRYQNMPTADTYWPNDDNTPSTKVYPDMSRLQTRMWFYQVATKYIKAGCEAIHFGQVDLMSKADPGHRYWWQMLSKVRAYAATNAARHLVLCDAHTAGMDGGKQPFYDPNPQNPLPPTQLGQTGSRQLLFDFHSGACRVQEVTSKQWAPSGAAPSCMRSRAPAGRLTGEAQAGLPS